MTDDGVGAVPEQDPNRLDVMAQGEPLYELERVVGVPVQPRKQPLEPLDRTW